MRLLASLAALAAAASLAQAQPVAATSRPFTVQSSPQLGPSPATEAVSRAFTLQFLPARRSPVSAEIMARAFTVEVLGVQLSAPEDPAGRRPPAIWFGGVSPNPFRQVAEVRYSLAQRVTAHLAVFDVAGRVVRRLADGVQEPGDHVLRWDGLGGDGRRLAAGVYLLRLRAGTFDQAHRIVLID
jgi:hypothetical protein